MTNSLSLIRHELENTGYQTLIVPPMLDHAEASTKTDAMRAIRSLQKVLSSSNKVKGISYAALYGIYELCKIRAKGKKLSDGQKAAVALTMVQLKKLRLFDRLKNLFTFGKKDGTVEQEFNDLEAWLTSDRDQQFEGDRQTDEQPDELTENEEQVEPDTDELAEDTGKSHVPGPMREHKKAAPRKATPKSGKLAAAPVKKATKRRAKVEAAALDAKIALTLVHRVEALVRNKAVRGALLTSAYGILGIIKKSAKNRRVDKFDHMAIMDSIKFISKSPKISEKLKEEFEEIGQEYESAFNS